MSRNIDFDMNLELNETDIVDTPARISSVAQQTPLVKNISDIASIAFITSFCYLNGGPWAGGRALISGITDASLMRSGITSKHYLSSATFLSSLGMVEFTESIIAGAPHYSNYIWTASIVGLVAVSYYSDDFLDFQKQISRPLEAFSLIQKIFDPKFYKEASKESLGKIEPNNTVINEFKITKNDINIAYAKVMALNFINTSITAASFYAIGIHCTGLDPQTIMQKFTQEKIDQNDLSNIYYEALKIGGIYFATTCLKHAIEMFEWWTRVHIEKLITAKTFDLSINHDNKFAGQLDKFELKSKFAYDLFAIDASVSKLLEEVQSCYSLLLYSSILGNKIPEWVYARLMISFLSQCSKFIDLADYGNKAAIQNKLLSKINEFTSQTYNKDMDMINLSESQAPMKSKMLAYNKQITQKAFDILLRNKFFTLVSVLVNFCSNAVDLKTLGEQIFEENPKIKLHEVLNFYSYFHNLSCFINRYMNYEISNQSLKISTQRLGKVLSLLEKEDIEAVKSFHNKDSIIFQNYILILPKHQIVIDNLEFASSKHYAIHGYSSCGKSSVFADIKTCLPSTLRSYGDIFLPKSAKITAISQNFSLIPGLSLFEFITESHGLGEKECEHIKEQILELMSFLKIDAEVSEESEDLKAKLDSTDVTLSGGQKKKIGIIKAIIAKPDILLLDETFAGLDETSIHLVESALTKYLPKTMIISIDHKFRDNNFALENKDGSKVKFYDQDYDFAQFMISEDGSNSTEFDIESDLVQTQDLDGLSDLIGSTPSPDIYHT
ncbi:MAG: ATP-binding cassette domain-containing protein [Rickettsiaceae bacterium]|nr:ATP-binding cassette domain-containing protein [Rickettsiaceae bacterium]